MSVTCLMNPLRSMLGLAALGTTGTDTALKLHSSSLQQALASLSEFGSLAHRSCGTQPLVVVASPWYMDVVAFETKKIMNVEI